MVARIVVQMGGIVNIKYVIAFSLTCFTLSAFAGPRFDPPPRATVEWVAPDTQAEGMQLQIRRFEVPSMTVEDVLKFYRQKWKELAAETELPPWQMIGTKQGGEYWNVQVQPRSDGGAWGFLSVSDLPDMIDKGKPIGSNATKGTGKNFPMMGGSVVISDLSQKDIGSTGRTLLLENDFSVSSNANFYRNYYESRGYNTMADQADARANSHVLVMNKMNKGVSVTINKVEGKTSIVANEVKSGF